MGSCIRKNKSQVEGERASCSYIAANRMPDSSESIAKRPRIMDPDSIEQLILDILRYTSMSHDSGDEEPPPLTMITHVADSELGWCDVVLGLVNTIPLHDPLGPSAIAIIFEFCPLPARDTVLGFTLSLDLRAERCALAYTSEECVRRERNLLFVLSCIADKFASNNSVHILTEDMLEYLIKFLVDERNPVLVLAALVVLEMLSGTAGNKATIEAALARRVLHPLLPLELHHEARDHAWRCVGFAARWALDNTFMFPGRSYTFETVDMSEVNVVLNTRDMTNYLKISPNGLEARCDSHSFESVRATFEIKSGCWYYEVVIITAGVMQIGWASKETHFDSHEGFGVGDDKFSIAFDGCRRLVWHEARPARVERSVRGWRAGDVVGCLADTERGEAVFSVNGHPLQACTPAFLAAGEGFYPAASFMADQQCLFNFGKDPFVFPPTDRPFQNMNKCGKLTPELKMIVPRRVDVELVLTEERPREKRCAVCFDNHGGFGVQPCNHSGFCARCVLLLEECPLCRSQVKNIYLWTP